LVKPQQRGHSGGSGGARGTIKPPGRAHSARARSLPEHSPPEKELKT